MKRSRRRKLDDGRPREFGGQPRPVDVKTTNSVFLFCCEFDFDFLLASLVAAGRMSPIWTTIMLELVFV